MTVDVPPKVFAVVVAYLPEIRALAVLVNSLVAQVEQVLIVDNSPASDRRVETLCEELYSDSVELVRLNENLGIARAFNVGIERAVAARATHVLLSDQDSEPASDMVAGLIRAERDLQMQGMRVGAVGPSFTNVNSGDLFPFLVAPKRSLFFKRRSASPVEPHVEAYTLISSGTLIPLAAIEEVGSMREDFFIDSVDTEWCYRARKNGFLLFGTAWATMLHRMGDSGLRVWYFGWFKANAYSPLRVYYQTRNLVRLHFLGYAGIRWRVRNIWSILGIFYFHVLYGSNRVEALRMAMRGILDGLNGTMGRFGSR